MDSHTAQPSFSSVMPNDFNPGTQGLAGFWRRLLAFIVDIVVVVFFGYVLGCFFEEQFVQLGYYAPWVGFLVCVLYSGVMNSRVGHGQSVGKRLLKVKVVDEDGVAVPVGKSFVRAFVLCLPFFIDKTMIPPIVSIQRNLALVFLVSVGMIGGLVYFYLFNGRTRQTLHDLVVKTFVVKVAHSGRVSSLPVWRFHYVMYALFFLCLLLGSLKWVSTVEKTKVFDGLRYVTYKLWQTGDFVMADFMSTRASGFSIFHKTLNVEIESVVANVFLKKRPDSYDRKIKKVAKIFMDHYPKARDIRSLHIKVKYGFDIGIASKFEMEEASYTPSSWLSSNRPKKKIDEVRWEDIPKGIDQNLLLRRKVFHLFKDKKYAALTSLLESYQASFEKDSQYEKKVNDAFSAFYIRVFDEDFKMKLDNWALQFPKSFVPYMARGVYYSAMGWESRGTSWAYQTSREQFEGMQNYFKLAYGDFRKALERNKMLVCAYKWMIDNHKNFSSSETGEYLIKKALAINPYCFYVRASYMYSLEPRWGGSYRAMESFADEAMAYADKNPKLKELRCLIDMDKGRMEEHHKKYESSISLYDQALTYGELSKVYHYRAYAKWSLKDYRAALDDFNKAVALNPQEDNYLGRATVLFDLGEVERSADDVAMARAIWPFDHEIKRYAQWVAEKLVYKGHVLSKTGRHQEAIRLFKQAIKFKPDHAEAYYWRGQTYARLRDVDKAESDYRKAVYYNPRYFSAYVSLDWALAQKKQWDDIIECWSDYIDLEPKNTRAYMERGGAYFHQGDYKSAAQDMKKACDMGDKEGCARYRSLQDKMN